VCPLATTRRHMVELNWVVSVHIESSGPSDWEFISRLPKDPPLYPVGSGGHAKEVLVANGQDIFRILNSTSSKPDVPSLLISSSTAY
jgi:hypothetical protein